MKIFRIIIALVIMVTVSSFAFGQSTMLPNGYEMIYIERITIPLSSLTQNTGLYFFVYLVNNRLNIEPIWVDNRLTEIKIDASPQGKSWIILKRGVAYENTKVIEIHLRNINEIEFN